MTTPVRTEEAPHGSAKTGGPKRRRTMDVPLMVVSPDVALATEAPVLPPSRKRKRPSPAAAPVEPAPEEQYLLRLYIAGVTARSTSAITNLKAICEEHLKGRYELDVVDIYQQPSLARRAQIVAAPTLIRRLPPPLRRIVGDMSHKDRVLVGLDLLPRV